MQRYGKRADGCQDLGLGLESESMFHRVRDGEARQTAPPTSVVRVVDDHYRDHTLMRGCKHGVNTAKQPHKKSLVRCTIPQQQTDRFWPRFDVKILASFFYLLLS